LSAPAGARVRPIFLVLAAAWAWVIWHLTTGQVDSSPSPFSVRLVWNGAHAFVFGVLAFLLLEGTPRRWWWVALLVCSAYGAFDEWYQGFVPGREPDVVDWLSDTLGATLGWTAARLVQAVPGQRVPLFWRFVAVGVLCFLSALWTTL